MHIGYSYFDKVLLMQMSFLSLLRLSLKYNPPLTGRLCNRGISYFSSEKVKKPTISSSASSSQKVYHKSQLLPETAHEPFSEAEAEAFLLDTGEEIKDQPLRLSKTGRPRDPAWYVKRLELLASHGDVNTLLDVFHRRMLREDRVMPSRFHFHTVLKGLANAGYSEMSEDTVKLMKSLRIRPNCVTYSLVFHAMAKDAEDPSTSAERRQAIGKRAMELWDSLRKYAETAPKFLEEEDDLLQDREESSSTTPSPLFNKITLNSLINCLAFCGMVQESFRIVDEMLALRWRPDEGTLFSLLRGCSKDPVMGAFLAIRVWQRFRQIRQLKPSPTLYIILLKALSDGGFGKEPSDAQVLLQTANSSDPFNYHQVMLQQSRSITDKARLRAETTVDALLSKCNNVEKNPAQDTADVVTPLEVEQSLVLLQSRSARLEMVGGMDGILAQMATDNVTPTVAHFNELARCLPPPPPWTEAEDPVEDHFLATMEKNGVQPDVGVFNMLLQRRSITRRDGSSLLAMMARRGLAPDVITFSCLARNVYCKAEAEELVASMRNAGISPNLRVCLAMIRGANLQQLAMVLQLMETNDISPSSFFIQRVEESIKHFRRRAERGTHVDKEKLFNFLKIYKAWLKRQNLREETSESPPPARYEPLVEDDKLL